MWTNFATPGWASMIVKPQATHTRLRCRGTWLGGLYPVLLVYALAALTLFNPSDALGVGSGRRTLEFTLGTLVLLLVVGGRFWLGNPEVRVDAAGITIQNLWRTTRIAWRDVDRLDLAGYAGITVKTRDQEILCAGLRCSALEWFPIARNSRRRARWELGLIRDWLDQCRAAAESGVVTAWDTRPPLR